MEEKNTEEKLEQIAGNENKDKNSVVYDDESHMLIDVDDILTGDFGISQKFNNLSEYGVSREQIKKLYEITNSSSDKLSLEDILKELEKVFVILATKINTSPSLGIVIDLNSGKEDEELSKLKCNDLGIDYETFEKKETEEKRGIMDVIADAIDVEKKSNQIDFKGSMFVMNYAENMFNDYNYDVFYTDISIEALSEFYIEMGIPEIEYANIEESQDYVMLDSLEDVNIIRAIYEYTQKINKNKDTNVLNFNLLEILGNNKNSKYYKELINDDGTIDPEKIQTFKQGWEKGRNELKVTDKLFGISKTVSKKDYAQLDSKDKADITITILRSLNQQDNASIKKIFDNIITNLGIDVSDKGIYELVYNTLGVKIETKEELEKLISTYEINNNTIEKELLEIEEAIEAETEEKDDKEETEKESALVRINRYKNSKKIRTFSNGIVANVFDTHLKFEEGDIKDYRALVVISLFDSYHKQKEPDKMMEKAIQTYIKDNKEYFENYFAKEGKSIFNKDNSISITGISNILKNTILPENINENKEFIEKLLEKVKKDINSRKNQEKTKIKNLEKVIATKKSSNEISEKDEEDVLSILNTIDIRALDDKIIGELRSLGSKEIKEKINKILLDKVETNKSSLNNGKYRTYDETVNENILLLEAKVEYSRGTSEYANRLIEREKYFENDPENREKAAKLRDENGELTEQAKNEVEEYVNKLLYETLKRNIDKTNVDKLSDSKKQTFTTFLLAGISDNNLENRLIAIEKLKQLYPQISEIEDIQEFKSEIFSIVYGDEIRGDYKKISKKTEEIKKHLITKVLDKKQPIDLKDVPVEDREFVKVFEKTAVELNTSEVDLSISEIQNRFNNSQIDFTEEDNKLYQKIYKETKVESWLGSKEEVAKQEIASLMLVVDYAQKNPEDTVLGKNPAAKFLKRLNKLIDTNPNIKEKYLKDGEILSEELMDEGKKFTQNKITSSLLEIFEKTILVDAENYENIDLWQKKDIFRYTLNIYKMSERFDQPEIKNMLKKLSYRTFELIGSEDKKFIDFDENGKEILNEKNIVNEYNGLFGPNLQSDTFEGITNKIVAKHCLMYTPMSLRHYSERDDKNFVPLEAKTIDGKLKEIENIRLVKIEEYKIEKEKEREIYSEEKKVSTTNEYEYEIDDSNQSKDEIESEYKKSQENSQKKFDLEAEEIKIVDENESVKNNPTFIEKIKNAINRLRQPKLTDGNISSKDNQGIFSRIANGVKNLFIKKDENIENKAFSNVNPRKAQTEYQDIQNTLDERIKVEDYDYQRAIKETKKTSELKNMKDKEQVEIETI